MLISFVFRRSSFVSVIVAKIKILGFNLSLIATRYRDKRDDGRYDDSEIIIVTHRRKRMVQLLGVCSFRFFFLKQQTLSNYVSLVKLHLFLIGINIPLEKSHT